MKKKSNTSGKRHNGDERESKDRKKNSNVVL